MQKYLHIILGVIIFSAILMSCRKDECLYSDEYDEFAGDTMGKMPGMWEWIYSRGPCGTKYPNFCYSSPQTEGYNLSLMFKTDGEYRKYRNDSLFENGGVTFTIRTPSPYPDQYQFQMEFVLCASKEFTAGQFFGIDTLLLTSYPFEYDGSNIFVRR